ncbi:MAG: hypothetical protein WBK28_03430 [Minisyncoccia bacterium]
MDDDECNELADRLENYVERLQGIDALPPGSAPAVIRGVADALLEEIAMLRDS